MRWEGAGLGLSLAWNIFGMKACLSFWNTLPKRPRMKALPGVGGSGPTATQGHLEAQQRQQCPEFHNLI